MPSLVRGSYDLIVYVDNVGNAKLSVPGQIISSFYATNPTVKTGSQGGSIISF
jgi:hypothetical protein